VAGLAVTPEGRPLTATATDPVKPFAGTAFTRICWAAPPGASVSAAGDAVREKSGGGGAAVTVALTAAEWLRVPEVPVSVTAKLAADTVEAAVRVTLFAVPGVRVKAAGFAVTPAGRPLTAMLTVPVKPLAGTALTPICWAEPPAARVMVAGDAVREKSGAGGAGETVAAITAEWLSVPEVPVSVMLKLAAEAVESAARVRLFAVPGVRVKVAGFAATPAGRPLTATVTMAAKPLAGTAFTLICCPVPPGTRETVAGLEVSEKSAVGGVDVDVEDVVAVVLVPQAVSASRKNRHAGQLPAWTAPERRRLAEKPAALAPGR